MVEGVQDVQAREARTARGEQGNNYQHAESQHVDAVDDEVRRHLQGRVG